MGLRYIVGETRDMKYIRDLVTDPYVWKWASDDSSPKLYFPSIGEGIIWVRVNDFGILMAQELSPSEWEVHVALNRSARGEALDIARAAMSWCRQRIGSPYSLVANIPNHNKLALRLAEKLGFKHAGTDIRPYTKGGETYRRDKYIYRQEV